VGLAVLDDEEPVEFTVVIERANGDTETLWAETHDDPGSWADRSIDLAHLAGETVGLVLGSSSETPAAVGLWGAPTVVGARDPGLPNVVFYVIDGAGADYMSLYGYNRRTTPNLDRIAAQGAVFERAYSNSGWTRPSTASFLTSLHHSVLGGQRQGFNPVPEGVSTMAEHMHGAGFQTAEFTTNPNAGRMSGLQRGVDVFREAGAAVTSRSSSELHQDYWRWRRAYPGEPYWVHFQTTDLHGPHTPVPPFAGLFLSADRRALAEEWNELMWRAPDGGEGIWGGNFEATGVDRIAYARAFRDYYDEGVAHQDYQLGKLVDRLVARGEWEHTLLIVASDHGAAAGSQDWRLLMREDAPVAVDYSDPGTPLYRTGVSRIPLVFVWPEKIAAGQRFSEPVSMIDVLPTVLDLVGLPLPEVMQGQSLAPLLRGEPGWEPRPVILDQFELDDDSGELRGRIEVIDGRWGASLEINADPTVREELRRPAPLLLHDLWTDPDAVYSLHEERPELVARYTELLEAQFAAHQALAQRFTASESVALTPEQLRTLRALGYIR
jgi:arylsulfatase A-like enzyme